MLDGTRIALYEADAVARYIRVDTRSKRIEDATDLHTLNPMGQVPVLRTDDGELLTENPAVLQYIADQFIAAALAPRDGLPRYRLQQWMNFISTELHKAVFIPLLAADSNDGARQFARTKATRSLQYLDEQLRGRAFLLDGFSVADAYLFTVLNWGQYSGIDPATWPAIEVYHRRLAQRPSITRALADEVAAHRTQQAQREAA